MVSTTMNLYSIMSAEMFFQYTKHITNQK